MKSKSLFILTAVSALLLIVAFSIPRQEKFWKGNMHTHSFWSDGNTFPEEVAWWYKSNGYNFLVVTDHNVLQEGEKWYNVDRNETTRETYDKYLEHFGGIGLDSEKRDENLWVRLRTLEEYRSQFEEDNEFMLISGEEITDASEKKPVHLNAINISAKVTPTKGESVASCLKSNVEAIKKQLMKDGNPEWISVNHPNFGWAMTADDIATSGARFFELYNGHPSVNNYGDDNNIGMEELWDIVNYWRINNDKPLLYAVANDDSHHYIDFNGTRANPGRGWSMVRGEELNTEALYSSMIKGDFYCSTGIELKNFESNQKQIKIKIKAEKGVEYTTSFVAIIKGESKSKVVSEQKGLSPKYKFTGEEMFVRATIRSNKIKENPFKEGDFEMAWIQPVQLNQ